MVKFWYYKIGRVNQENLANEYTNAANFGASMTQIFVGPSRSDTSNLSRKDAFSMTITWNSWSDLFPIDVLLRGQQDT